MIADAHPAPIKLTAKRPFYATASAPSGSTHTVSGTSTVTLYNRAEQPYNKVTLAFEDYTLANAANYQIAVTGQETGAQLDLLAWYVLDPTTLSLAPGVYKLVFTIAATGSDTIVRTFVISLMIIVEAASA